MQFRHFHVTGDPSINDGHSSSAEVFIDTGRWRFPLSDHIISHAINRLIRFSFPAIFIWAKAIHQLLDVLPSHRHVIITLFHRQISNRLIRHPIAGFHCHPEYRSYRHHPIAIAGHGGVKLKKKSRAIFISKEISSLPAFQEVSGFSEMRGCGR